MNHALLRPALPLAAFLSSLALATAQDNPVRFVPKTPMIRVAVYDLPALRAALPNTKLGKLFAEPDVATAFATGQSNYEAKRNRWARAYDAMLVLEPLQLSPEDAAERESMSLDWRDVRNVVLAATRPDDAQWFAMQSTFLIEPLAAAEGRWEQRFEALARRVKQVATGAKFQLAEPQAIDGFAAVVLTPGEQPEEQQNGTVPGMWLLHLPGQFAGGSGKPAMAGSCKPAARSSPAVAIELDMRSYLRLISRSFGQGEATILEAIGLDAVASLTWHLQPAGELLQDDIALQFDGRPKGVLGALLDGMAPLVAQPLPEHAMLQVRCGFDARALAQLASSQLEQLGLPALGGLTDELHKAWSGGMALAVARPARGAIVPRLYASFGIVDEQALTRLLARLLTDADIQTKDVTLDGQACVQLRIDGLPAGFQPCYCIKDGALHIAESGPSLRAMLKAAADGAPAALDVGDAPRPESTGALLPGFDLRFDGAAMHAAMHELWLPLWAKLVPSDDFMKPVLPVDDMPGHEVVTPHLTKGRGVLRRRPDGLVLSMSGTTGGPELHALLAAYGPMLSGSMTNNWHFRTLQLEQALARLKLGKLHAAIAAFTERTGKAPASLGELLSAPEPIDKGVLLIDGDELAEPVMHNGKQVAKTSFRYYADGIKVSPQGEQVTVHLIMIKALGWQRTAVAKDGTVHEGWGSFAELSIDDLERAR